MADSAMVERVARVLCRSQTAPIPGRDIDGWVEKMWRAYRHPARAAIETIREPTEAMIAVANRLNHPRDEETWLAMIAAALGGDQQ